MQSDAGVLAVGSHVGAYTIGMPIGIGGIGVVYEATTPEGAHVALKMLRPEQREIDDARRRFHDEAIAGMTTKHPGVASTLAYGVTADGTPFLVMERVRGETLADRVRNGRPLSLFRSAAIMRQILAGLQSMHDAGIVHGDVKSDNVLVDTQQDGDVAKLIDFGLARVQFTKTDVGSESGEPVVAGTPEYMAPEVIRGLGASPASDLYAAGVLLFELITGTTPFAGGTIEQVMRGQVADPPVPPSLRRPATPPILDRIVMRALEKDPALRFPNPATFASALRVAMSVLDNVDDEPGTTGFSREAPTLDFVLRGTVERVRYRRLAKGTPAPARLNDGDHRHVERGD